MIKLKQISNISVVEFGYFVAIIHTFIYLLIHALSKYLIIVSYIPGTVIDTGNKTMNKTGYSLSRNF